MSDPLVEALEAKGLRNVRVERAPAGHATSVRAERADGIEVAVLMDRPGEDTLWVNAVWARADPEGFMAALAADDSARGGDA